VNRIVAGTAALAAAVVLCAAGGSSTAYWQDAETTTSFTMTTGSLTLTPIADTARWMLDGAPLESDARVVPGSSVGYTQTFEVQMTGDGLAATVGIGPGAVSAMADTFQLASAELIGAGIEASGTPGLWRVRDGGEVTVALQYDWPAGAAVDDDSQGVSIGIDASTLLLAQVTP
jgi:alternate signal-mediated exported protein